MYNENVSGFSRQGESLASVTPDKICITCQNKRKKKPASLVLRK